MLWLTLMLSAENGAPPAGDWIPITREDSAPSGELALGSFPFDSPQTDPQKALVAGVLLLEQLQQHVSAPPDGADFQVHLAHAQAALDLSEKVLAQLAPCQAELQLQPIARVRAADAVRLASMSFESIPVLGMTQADRVVFESTVAQIRAPLLAQAQESYERVAKDPTAPIAWRGHAR
ncbi:MAG: hypothetical protein ACI9VR_003729, partial [Cognaticolwellia sp.]